MDPSAPRGKVPIEHAVSQAPEKDVFSYINFAQTSMNLWEITLSVGRVVKVMPEENKVELDRVISLAMSPEQAVAIMLTLKGATEAYRSKFGDIRFPQKSGAPPITAVNTPEKPENSPTG